MTNARQTIARARQTFRTAFGLNVAAVWLAWWMVGAGALILALKATGYHVFFQPSYVFLSVAPVGVVVLIRTLFCGFTDTDVAAWLDLKNACGGRLIDLLQRDHLAGEEDAVVQNLSLEAGVSLFPFLRRVGMPAVFFGAALWMPGAHRETTVSTAYLVSRVAQVRQQIDLVKSCDVLPADMVVALDQQLDRTMAQAGRSPEAAAEAIDKVQQTLEQSILEQAQSIQKGMEAAEQVAQSEMDQEALDNPALAESLSMALKAMPDMAELPPEMRRMLEDLMKKMDCSSCRQLAEKLPANLAQLDPETLRRLAEKMAASQGQRLQDFAAMQEFLTDAQLKQLLEEMMTNGKASQGLSEETLAGLRGMSGDSGMSGMPGSGSGSSGSGSSASAAGGGPPGRGGVSRGRGDADLTFGRESNGKDMAFKPKVIKTEGGSIPGVTVAKTRMTATDIPPVEFQQTGRSGVVVGATTGGDMMGAALGPSRRKVAARYFSEEKP